MIETTLFGQDRPAHCAMYVATSSASLPLTRLSGIGADANRIWSRMTCRIVLSLNPWRLSAENAWSRFGPIAPLDPASRIVWQEPQRPFVRKSFLPFDGSPLFAIPPSPHPAAIAASARASGTAARARTALRGRLTRGADL